VGRHGGGRRLTGRQRQQGTLVAGKTVVTNTGCAQLAEDLKREGYTPVAVELDEFLKAGGSAKCLTLRLDGEEAAAWVQMGESP